MNVKQTLKRLKYLVCLAVVFTSISSTLNAQDLNFEFKNRPLKVVLAKITDQTGYNFVYSDALTSINKNVSVVAKKENPEKFFKRFFPTIGIIYKIQDKQVSLSSGDITNQKKETTKNPKDSKFKIEGKVTDIKGEPLTGVSVLNLSNKTGAYTDLDGKYSLYVKVGDLVCYTFIGFKKQEHSITKEFTSKNNVLNIVLEEDAIALESVAVIGYGNTQKIKDITGSISHIGAKELETAPMASSIQSALQGRAAGVNVQLQSASPTSPVSIIIRGQSSISGNNQPLWVIDGVPEYNAGVSGDVSNVLYSLNLNDVESIDILKDASSTAIYGSRAANGVIVVTTRSGKEGLKPTLEFTTRFGAEFIDFNNYDYFDTPQYIDFTKKWTRDVIGVTGSASGEHDYLDLDAFRALNTSEIDTRKMIELPDAYYDENNYWLGEMTQTPIQQQYDLTLRGGTKAVSYLTSLNYLSREGVVKTGSNDIYGGKIRL